MHPTRFTVGDWLPLSSAVRGQAPKDAFCDLLQNLTSSSAVWIQLTLGQPLCSLSYILLGRHGMKPSKQPATG